MKGRTYAAIIINACDDLKHQYGGVDPVVNDVYRTGELGPRWSRVLCHPDDVSKTDEKEFIHPYRDI